MVDEIVHCFKCKTRLTWDDFEAGRAVRLFDKVACSKCEPQLLSAVSPSEKGVPLAFKIFGIGGAAVGVLSLIIFLLVRGSGGKEEPAKPVPKAPTPPPTASKPPAPKPPHPKVPTREEEAVSALEEVRRQGKERPEDFKGRIERLIQFCLEWEETAAAEEAQKEADALKEQLARKIEADFKELDATLQPDLEAGKFGKALKALDEAWNRRAGNDWQLGIRSRIQEIEKQAQAAYPELEAEAVDARRQGAEEEERRLRQKVTDLGMEDLTEKLDAALARIEMEKTNEEKAKEEEAKKPPKPPPAPKVDAAKVAAERWQSAMALAVDRDYTGAIQILLEAMKEAKDDAVHQELDRDIQLLKATRTLIGALREDFSRFRRGAKVVLPHLNAEGKRKDLEGTVNSAAGWWLEATVYEKDDKGKRIKKLVTVGFPELEREALGGLIKERKGEPSEEEVRARALFSLLEGDAEGAKTALGGKTDGFPKKYWTFAQNRGTASVEKDPREEEARAVFYGVYPLERFYEPWQSRGGSSEIYRKLLKEYGDLRFVRRHRELLQERAAPAHEYLFFGEGLKGAGGFRLTSRTHPRTFWQSSVNSDPSALPTDYVEIAYEAIPEQEYRCWVYVGGCCQETMIFHMQATGLTVTDPKTKQATKADPGSNVAMAVKPRAYSTPRSHAMCIKANREKGPHAWAWALLPLPKITEGGPRKIRILTEHKGFSVAYAVVSAKRRRTPTDKEMAKLDERPGEAEDEFKGPTVGMVGYWSFDEGLGTTSKDRTERGNDATLRGATWARGRFGNALKFDDKMAMAEIPGHKDLDLSKKFSVCVWINMSKPGRGKPIIVAQDRKSPSGIRLESQSKRVGCFWNNVGDKGEWGGEIKAGVWHHIAAVVEGDAPGGARAKLYLDGTEVATYTSREDRRPKPSTKEIILGGNAQPGKDEWTYYGLIDELRIYNRLLTAREIMLLARGKR